MTAHDVAVVGAGHNGLTLAAYLVRAGLDVGVHELAVTAALAWWAFSPKARRLRRT